MPSTLPDEAYGRIDITFKGDQGKNIIMTLINVRVMKGVEGDREGGRSWLERTEKKGAKVKYIIQFSDAFYADDIETCHCSQGYYFPLLNDKIDWKAFKRRTVANIWRPSFIITADGITMALPH